MANQKKTFMSVLLNGLIWENPTFVLMLGMCPTLAITTSGMNGIGMGLAVTAVLIFSNLFISLLRNIIPDSVRIPAYIIIIASFVTMIDMLLKAFLPDLSQALGMFIPLIVVNCIIFARAESFASKNPPVLSIAEVRFIRSSIFSRTGSNSLTRLSGIGLKLLSTCSLIGSSIRRRQ